MLVEEPSSPQESSPTRIIKDVLSDLEPEGSELAIVPLEVGEEAGPSANMAEEASRDSGLEGRIAR